MFEVPPQTNLIKISRTGSEVLVLLKLHNGSHVDGQDLLVYTLMSPQRDLSHNLSLGACLSRLPAECLTGAPRFAGRPLAPRLLPTPDPTSVSRLGSLSCSGPKMLRHDASAPVPDTPLISKPGALPSDSIPSRCARHHSQCHRPKPRRHSL